MCMSLVLLPAQDFEAGLNLIQTIVDAVAQQYPQLLQFTAYMRLQWLPRIILFVFTAAPFAQIMKLGHLIANFRNDLAELDKMFIHFLVSDLYY